MEWDYVDVVAALQGLVALFFYFRSEVELSADRCVRSPNTKIFSLITIGFIVGVYWSAAQEEWQSEILVGIVVAWIASLFLLADQKPR